MIVTLTPMEGERKIEAEQHPVATPLIRSLGLGNPFVDQFSSGETFADSVPVGNALLSQFPAEKHGSTVNFAGKIEQADVKILDLDARRVDFRKSIFDALDRLLPLSFPAGHVNDVDQNTAL